MKYKGHIATGDYEFIEVESDDRDELIQEYMNIKGIFKDREGHNVKDWARVRNTYVNTGEISIEDLENCNRSQRYFINEVKLVIKKNKHEE